jgi:hypothetical protein
MVCFAKGQLDPSLASLPDGLTYHCGGKDGRQGNREPDNGDKKVLHRAHLHPPSASVCRPKATDGASDTMHYYGV